QETISLAQQLLVGNNQNQLGTEHLLLALLSDFQGTVSKIFKVLGVDIDTAKTKVNQVISLSKKKSSAPKSGVAQIFITPEAQQVFTVAEQVAKELGDKQVGTEHLLLAIAKSDAGSGAVVLIELGLNVADIENAIKQIKGSADFEDENSPSLLKKYGTNLTELASKGELDPVIGRETEIKRVMQILSRRTKNNPVLIGDPGVGKTAIVDGLAQKIVNKEVPELLKDKEVISLQMGTIVAGTKFRGEFEERLKGLLDEIKKRKGEIVLFIDELHTVVGAGAAEGAIDASNMMKPMLSRGNLQAVGATTIDEYRKYIEKDHALERRFQPINVDEPSVENTVSILKGLRPRYEDHHKVKISDEALEAAAKLSKRYISDRFLPDKAIDLIDEAASKQRLESIILPPNLMKLENKLLDLTKEGKQAADDRDFEKAAKIRSETDTIQKELKEKKDKWLKEKGIPKSATVSAEHIAQVVAGWTGIPVTNLLQTESERLVHMEKQLHKRIIGQEEAVKVVSEAVRRTRAGLKDPNRPIGSFIFMGPTGVGKTELSKALAEFMFDDEGALIRIDMSEYQEKHTVSRLVGAPPGYVGYDKGGQLTEAIRRRPYSVILLDEIEKAHPDVFNVLLQILEDGRLTDNHGHTVDFKNTIVIMTSNLGARDLQKSSLGFGESKGSLDYEEIKKKVLTELKKTFRPELLNRIDEIIVFHPLKEEHLTKIIDLLLDKLYKSLEEKNLKLNICDDVKKLIVKDGYSPEYGARPLRRSIQQLLENPLSMQIIEGKFNDGDSIDVSAKNGKVAFSKKEKLASSKA
ncbi:MAG: AAA family ATPase, partial [Actinobacteria bacterium]